MGLFDLTDNGRAAIPLKQITESQSFINAYDNQSYIPATYFVDLRDCKSDQSVPDKRAPAQR